ncbi:MAG: SufE family protein [Opitutus sp.]
MQKSLVDDLRHHEDGHERLSAVIERTRRTPRFPAEERSAEHRVPGCSSSVWLLPQFADGRCSFRSDADSPVVRGLVALVADYFSGSTPPEILNSNDDPLELLDLNRGLSHTRRHGLAAVLAAIRVFAQRHV